MPKLTAIVVSYNARDALVSCLRSLQSSRHVQLRIIVIDNASTESNVATIRSAFPTVELIVNTSNRGFAAAVNQGLERSNGDVVLINPDLDVEPDCLAVMHRQLSEHPRVGIVGPRLSYPDGRLQPSIKRFPKLSDFIWILSKIPNFFPNVVRSYNGLDVDYERTQTVDQVMGACFMIRRQTLDEVGTFDEGFWMWFEEVDYCLRARNHAWLVLYTPAAHAVHQRGASFKHEAAARKQQALRNSMRHYAQKYFGRAATLVLLPGLLISWLSGFVLDTLRLAKPERAKNL